MINEAALRLNLKTAVFLRLHHPADEEGASLFLMPQLFVLNSSQQASPGVKSSPQAGPQEASSSLR
jgi:hypothetical protein